MSYLVKSFKTLYILFFRAEIYDENFVTVEMNPSKVKMTRPRYLGVVILNLAKHVM